MGSRASWYGLLQSISNSFCWSKSQDCIVCQKGITSESPAANKQLEFPVQNKPPELVKIVNDETKPVQPLKTCRGK